MAGCCSSTAERARKALGAMKQLGFSKKQATPVLKRLLKLYDHNWDLIEDECYRALADAILDSAAAANHTASTSASLTHCATADDDYEAPLVKRPRLDSGQISPLSGDPQAALVLEEPKPQLATHGSAAKQVIVASSGADAGGRAANQQHSHHSSLHALRGCKNEFGSSSFQDTHVGHFVELDVASSTLGEVKMSLKCNFDPLRFSINLDKVLKMVEDKCIHSYLIQPPAFSVTKLMNEVCQCAVQLASANSEIHSDGANLQKEAVDTDIPFVKPISCMNAIGGNNNAAGGLSMLVSSGTILQNSIVARQPELALSKQRPIHDVSDISKGEERARISIVNEFGSESCPPFFNYIQKNIVFQNAFVNISIARIGNEDCCANCSANCLSSPLPCACARATGGEFAYTSEGLIRATFLDECISVNHSPENHKTYCKTTCPFERAKNSSSPDQCKGHLVRKFIKECWSKCGCTMHCGNRVVQRGITSNLQVFFTREGKGWGLRTLDELPKGSFICEYAGEILTSMELYERTVENARNAKHMHQVLLDADWGSERVLRDEEALCIDATFYGNVGRFVNHRCCDANLILIPVEVETPDHCYYHLAFFTAKKVEVFEELTWDYGIDFDGMDCPEKAFRCMCGSRYCRDLTNSRRRNRAAARRN